MKSRYVEINREEMRAMLEDEMGFKRLELPGCGEIVWQRVVETKSGKRYPYAVRIYSSIAKSGGVSRACGEDAIRVVLMDLDTGKAMKLKSGKGKAGKRIYRTKNALPNLKARCREYFKTVMSEGCPKCGAVMAERLGTNGIFLGCTKYPKCNGTKSV